MANLAASAVTINKRYKDTGAFGANRLVVDATLVLTGQGGTSNLIPAALFGMSSIEQVHSARGSDNVNYVAAPSYDGASINLALVNGATGAAADVSSKTVRLVVVGIEAFV